MTELTEEDCTLRRTLAGVKGDSWLAEAARSSLRAADQKFCPIHSRPLTPPADER